MLGFGQESKTKQQLKRLISDEISFSASYDYPKIKKFKLLANSKYKKVSSNGYGFTPVGDEDIWIIDDDDNLNITYNEFITFVIPLVNNGYGRWYNKEGSSGSISNITFSLIALNQIEDLVKNYVEQRINIWQIKSEFEKIVMYQERVNENSRNKMIDLYQVEAINHFKKMAIDKFDSKSITLQKYDAENETFLLKLSDTKSFPLPVPINEAKSFKQNFNTSLFTNIDMVIKGNTFILSHIEYEKNGNKYVYDISDKYSYATTTLDYNFDEIDIDIKESRSSNTFKTSNTSIRLGNSFVDSNIPENKKVNNRYALVIGNQDYTSYQRTLSSEQNVDYAENDATIFKQYCLNTLGVKEDNMHFLLNATAGQMSQEIDLVSKIVSKLGPDAELIVYYAGHGYPDELTKVPYLIPVDVSASNLSSALKLSDLYSKLSDTKASKVTIFLDACFTGGGRTSGLLASRGVKVRPKEGSLSGNLIVFSASSGDQSSLPYHKEAHGMFTYHVLKKLQESEGNVSMGELSDYLVDSVSIRSLKENEKEQDPNVNISQEVIDDWINWKF